MRWKAVLVVGCLAPLGGCTTLKLAGHNLVHEPVQHEDDRKIRFRLRHDGQKYWNTIAANYPKRTFSPDFKDGFLDGYVDYLDSGGRAEPPLIPPTQYRRSKYYCPEGQALVRDYFAGFKYGAEVACATGRRQFLTVPVLIPNAQPEVPLDITVDEAPPEHMPPPPPLPSEEAAAGRPLPPLPVPETGRSGSFRLDPPKPVTGPTPETKPAIPNLPGFPGSGGASSLPRSELLKADSRTPRPSEPIRPASGSAEPEGVAPEFLPPVDEPPE